VTTAAAVLLLPCALLTAQELRVRSVQGQADVQPDHIATQRNSQVDIELGLFAGFRLQANSRILIGRRGDGRYRLELVQGGLTYDVVTAAAPSVEIATPSVGVWPAIPGLYEISVTSASESVIVARAGRIEVVAPAGSQWVETGQKLIARGSPQDPRFRIVSALSVWRRLAILVSNLHLSGGNGAASDDTSTTDSSSASSSSHSSSPAHSSAPVTQSSASAAAAASHSGHGK
jgi:hypothetical protein